MRRGTGDGPRHARRHSMRTRTRRLCTVRVRVSGFVQQFVQVVVVVVVHNGIDNDGQCMGHLQRHQHQRHEKQRQ